MHWWLVSLVSLSAAWWAVQALALTHAVRRLPRVADMPREAREVWPRLSLVVPARDEGQQLEGAARSRLAEGYPELELVIVDDRSNDDTGTIADRLARSDPRVVVEHVEALPDGWLGKVHAMHRGLARAGGEWVLFTDADIHLEPGTLERVIAWAEREGSRPSSSPRPRNSASLSGSACRAGRRCCRAPRSSRWAGPSPAPQRSRGGVAASSGAARSTRRPSCVLVRGSVGDVCGGSSVAGPDLTAAGSRSR